MLNSSWLCAMAHSIIFIALRLLSLSSQLIHNITSPYTRIEEINQQQRQTQHGNGLKSFLFLLALIKIPHQFAIKKMKQEWTRLPTPPRPHQTPIQCKVSSNLSFSSCLCWWNSFFRRCCNFFTTNLFVCYLQSTPATIIRIAPTTQCSPVPHRCDHSRRLHLISSIGRSDDSI